MPKPQIKLGNKGGSLASQMRERNWQIRLTELLLGNRSGNTPVSYIRETSGSYIRETSGNLRRGGRAAHRQAQSRRKAAADAGEFAAVGPSASDSSE